MPNESSVASTTEGEPTKVDTLASEACTRSGAFALLLSVALLLLVPYWIERPQFIALGRYVSYRLNLAGAINDLDDNPFWQSYKVSNGGAESMSIGDLVKVTVETNQGKALTTEQKLAPTRGHKAGHSAATAPQRTAPPSGLTVSVREGIDEMPQILKLLSGLNDSDTLSLSRRVSNFFDFSIVRWVQKRNMLAYRNCAMGPITVPSLTAPIPAKTSTYFVPALYEEVLSKCLTLGDVRELSKVELPTIANSTDLGSRIAKEVDVTPGLLPRDLFMASILAQVLLFFVLMHFNAFVREAVSSPRFPVQGTLFSAFARSRLTLSVLFLATCTPFLASALIWATSLAASSAARKLILLAGTVLVACASLSIQFAFQQKSYFRGVFARFALLRRKRSG